MRWQVKGVGQMRDRGASEGGAKIQITIKAKKKMLRKGCSLGEGKKMKGERRDGRRNDGPLKGRKETEEEKWRLKTRKNGRVEIKRMGEKRR